MISVVYVTNRSSHPFTDPALRERSQYEVLAECLAAQTFRDFELVLVTPDVEAADGILAPRFPHPYRVVPPRPTPWRKLGAFAPASARNTGLLAARGEVVLALDDCVTFGPKLLSWVDGMLRHGRCYVPRYMRPTGEVAALMDGQKRGGILTYPRELALKLGGWEERFDGVFALEDWEFSERLARNGVVWYDGDEAVILRGHKPHEARPYSEAGPSGYYRCCWAVYRLTGGQAEANRPWTPDDLQVFTQARCRYITDDAGCKVQPHPLFDNRPSKLPPCMCPDRPGPAALAIMREYESSAFSPFH